MQKKGTEGRIISRVVVRFFICSTNLAPISLPVGDQLVASN
jgi:hypothetical protein